MNLRLELVEQVMVVGQDHVSWVPWWCLAPTLAALAAELVASG